MTIEYRIKFENGAITVTQSINQGSATSPASLQTKPGGAGELSNTYVAPGGGAADPAGTGGGAADQAGTGGGAADPSGTGGTFPGGSIFVFSPMIFMGSGTIGSGGGAADQAGTGGGAADPAGPGGGGAELKRGEALKPALTEDPTGAGDGAPAASASRKKK